jgi:hypothetical protein
MTARRFGPCSPVDVGWLDFDLSDNAGTATIEGTPTFSADPPTITLSTIAVVGQTAYVWFSNAAPAVDYTIICTYQLSDGRVTSRAAHMTCLSVIDGSVDVPA